MVEASIFKLLCSVSRVLTNCKKKKLFQVSINSMPLNFE